ncbi:AraC family ligand binding domain-containing protein [Serratia ureilytica]
MQANAAIPGILARSGLALRRAAAPARAGPATSPTITRPFPLVPSMAAPAFHRCRRWPGSPVPGTLVFVPASRVHACNPAPDTAWSYQMLHLDAAWLQAVRREYARTDAMDDEPVRIVTDPAVYAHFCRLNVLLFRKATRSRGGRADRVRRGLRHRTGLSIKGRPCRRTWRSGFGPPWTVCVLRPPPLPPGSWQTWQA